MRFRNSIRLLLINFKNSYKILLYHLIVVLIGGAISATFIVPNLRVITESVEMTTVKDKIYWFLHSLGSGNVDGLTDFNDSFWGEDGAAHALLLLVKSHSQNIFFSLLGVALVYLGKRFLDILCYYAVGNIMNDKMSSYMTTSFSDGFVKSLGSACKFALVYVPVVFLLDAVIYVLGYFVLIGLIKAVGVLIALSGTVTFLIFAQALKVSVTNFWLPALIVDGVPLKNAIFGKYVKGQKAGKMYMTYVSALYFVVVVNIIAGVCTIGSALIITMPASYFFFICLQFVNYYTVTGRSYFITYENVFKNPSYGKSEEFIVAMERAKDESLSEEQIVYPSFEKDKEDTSVEAKKENTALAAEKESPEEKGN